ncbi:MAG: glutamine synthetase, glutamine synthetase [Candidatus Peregrinibacteria bacterium GW2011_GWC2_39_14]|nr:MAG: glutamine synthetase, glutamine synthetase [Candidatus Peregrinibacteria bacterium GW2011_GWC2_39_14]
MPTKAAAVRRNYYKDLPKTGVTKQMIMDIVKHEGIEFVNMQFIDIFGIVKGITVPTSKLEDAIDHNVWFDGSSIEGYARIFESDMYLKPDLDTFAIIPWTRENAPTARIICDVYTPDDKPFAGDPRGVLKRQLLEAKKLGFTYYTGPELEFFLFKKDEEGNITPLPHDSGSYFDFATDLGEEIRKEMCFALEEMRIDVERSTHEVANGQQEIGFKYDNALSAADNAVTFKYVMKTIAAKHDLYATFMPKPIFGINGSGMHVHQSLFKDGKNAFYKKGDAPYYFSDMAKSFIAGQLTHIREMSAILDPIVNSYKRLVAGYEAPVYIAWGQMNRSALIRVPRFTTGRGEATRCELRCPDPTCNPYLAFSVMLAAGLDGIKKKMVPPKPVEENIYHLSEADRNLKSIASLPKNLFEALQELKKSNLVESVLGEHIFGKYYDAKMKEWDEYRIRVTQWELDKYLERY